MGRRENAAFDYYTQLLRPITSSSSLYLTSCYRFKVVADNQSPNWLVYYNMADNRIVLIVTAQATSSSLNNLSYFNRLRYTISPATISFYHGKKLHHFG